MRSWAGMSAVSPSEYADRFVKRVIDAYVVDYRPPEDRSAVPN